MTKTIKNEEFGGERPLFGSHGLKLENVIIHAGESALKECSDIDATECTFEGKYPFWHVNRFRINHCIFRPGARAALWYSRNLLMTDTLVEAPKMFREMENLELCSVEILDAEETFWHCRGVRLTGVSVRNADYLFMGSSIMEITNYKQQGNYSFQYCKDVTIRNAEIDTKDAFWESENVTVIDSTIRGEYLGWHSKNLRLINCLIEGTQPLCYAEHLVMENCRMGADADLAFEYSTVDAQIRGNVTSIKNPRSGRIVCDSVGELILDQNIKAPADCEIITAKA